MMNYVWGIILAFSFISAIFNNRLTQLSGGILTASQAAVETALKLMGSLALWNGITEIMSEAGLDKKLDKLMSPFIRLLFPSYKNTPAAASITANITANLLGLGNAATPLGIEAMRRIKAVNGSDTADNETVRFVVINSAALTLIPTTIASIRGGHGSEAPFSIIIPVWLTGITALVLGLLAEKFLGKRWK